MGARKLYEEKILELIKNIPEEELPKVVSLIEKRTCNLMLSVKCVVNTLSRKNICR